MAVQRHRGARHHAGHGAQVVAQQLKPLQAARHGGQGLQQGRHGAAVGRLLHRLQQGGHVGQQAFGGAVAGAERLHDLRPLLQQRQHRLRPPAHLAQRPRAVQPGVQPRRAQQAGGFPQAVGEHRLHRRERAIEPGAPGFELRRHAGRVSEIR